MGENLRHPGIQLLYGAELINGKRHNLSITKKYILKEYNDVLSGIGTLLGDNYHIKLKEDYKPVAHPPRSIPVKLKPAYKEELQWLCSEGIITPVWQHTEWTNSIVPVRKANGSLRICLHHKDFNKNIERNQYYTGTIDYLSAEFHGSRYFFLMDTKSGYWMFLLDKTAHCLQHSSQPWVKFKWLWLPFGLSVSSDVIQERLDAVIKMVPDVTGIGDDVLAKGDSDINHDIVVLILPETAQNNNVKFNPEKI